MGIIKIIAKQKSRGFTLVEMLVIAPIVILVIGVFIGVIVNLTGEVLAAKAYNAMAYNIQNALDRIRQDVSLSGSFLAANNITPITPQGYDDGTTGFKSTEEIGGDTHTRLILNAYTTASNPASSTRDLVYASSQPNQCNSSQVNKNTPIMFNVIYFVKDNTLWRRIIAPSQYTAYSCSTPWQRPSCSSSGLINGTSCKTLDEKLVEDVSISDFTISYYTSSNPTTVVTDANSTNDTTRTDAISTVNIADVSITASATVAGRDISQTGSVRVIGTNNNTTATTVPESCPTGFIRIPGSITYGTFDFCVMKYEAKNDGSNNPISQASGAPWAIGVSQLDAITYSQNVTGCTGCKLMTVPERLTIQQNVLSVASNWAGGVIGSVAYIGHSDGDPNNSLPANTDDSLGYDGTGQTSGDQRRTLTLTNGEVIWDFSGNVWEWVNASIAADKLPGLSSDSASHPMEWNSSGLILDDFPSLYLPKYGTPAAIDWGNEAPYSNNIGQLYSNYNDPSTSMRGYRYGGDWSSRITAGITMLSLGSKTDYNLSSSIGFRVTR